MPGSGSSATPRPEHPRPDLHRGLCAGVHWLNLNGEWRFEFDPDGAGLDEGWQGVGEERFTRTIRVPFPWESHLAWGTEDQAGNENWFSTEAYLEPETVTKDNYREAPRHTIGWYRREFEVPPGWQRRRVWLTIGAADWELRAWINGVEVGAEESGYLPVALDITDALQDGANTLVIRVEDPEDHSQQPVGKQVSNWYTRTSGIWQTVWLEPRPAEHITEVLVEPDLSGEQATLRVSTDASAEAMIAAQVRASTGGQSFEAEPVALEAEGETRVTIEMPDAIPWTPDAPHIYRVQVTLLRDGEVIDTVHTQFGMREIDVGPLYDDGPNYVRLNGEPVYLRGALDQNFHPEGVYAFPSNEAVKRDMMLAKQAGLNFLRLHIKTPDPRYCYWADRCGILLMCDIPNFGYDGYSEIARERWERAARGQIRRDFNHPSIFAWCLFNETWGLGGREYAESVERQDWVRECYESAKRLDPTRLVEDNSPCLNDHVVTDINSWHFYINDYEEAREHVEDVVARTHPGSDFNFVGGNTQSAEPLLNSEYGGISARMGDLDVSWCLRFLTNELRRHETICGYVYTELTDIEWEHNGLYNYDRSRKQFGYDPALLLGEQFVGIDGPPGRTVAPGEEVALRVFLRPSARAASMAARVSWRATFTDALGGTRAIVREAALSDLADGGGMMRLQVPDEPGLVHIEARLRDGAGRICAANFCVLEIVGEREDAGRADAELVALNPGDARVTCDGDVEIGEVEGEAHLLACRQGAVLQYDFPVSGRIARQTVSGVTVLCEMSSAREGAPQTEEGDEWPSRADISIAGTHAATVLMPDQPADARGALSHMHGFQGRYGRLITARLSGEAAREALRGETVAVRIEAREPDGAGGGIAIYGARAGRYPCAVNLLIE